MTYFYMTLYKSLEWRDTLNDKSLFRGIKQSELNQIACNDLLFILEVN